MFLHVCNTSLLKTQREKEKLLVMSNFFLPHNVFCFGGKLSVNFIEIRIVVCKFLKILKFIVWEKEMNQCQGSKSQNLLLNKCQYIIDSIELMYIKKFDNS